MLAYIKGKIFEKNDNYLIVLTNDLGYKIFTTIHFLTTAKKDDEVALYLYHHIKEDSQDLYGFLAHEEMEMFEALISVSGIGPKTAISALSLTTVAKIRQAISKGDPTLLKQVSGIGPKTAQRVVIELKEKMLKLNPCIANDQEFEVDNEVVEALVGLGYTVMQARQAVNDIPCEIKGVQARIKQALKKLGK